jgi:molecular chaperone GrpE
MGFEPELWQGETSSLPSRGLALPKRRSKLYMTPQVRIGDCPDGGYTSAGLSSPPLAGPKGAQPITMCASSNDVMNPANEHPSQPGEPTADAEAPVDAVDDGALSSEAPEEALEATRAELERVKGQLLRTAADFDNFRKRSRRELSDAERTGREDTIRQLLPVFDNLERASDHAETATDVKALAEGIALVMRQFLDTLNKLGVERVESVNRPFDPSVHEAIQHLETAEYEPGTVAVEVQPGYRMADRLIRPALVVVAKTPANRA